MEGGGGHAPPRSARLRGPPPPFSRATSTSARFARRPNSWNAPLSLRYDALTRACQRPASRGSASSRFESAASDAWRPRSQQRRRRRRRSSSGPRDTRRPAPNDPPSRAVGCARPSLARSLGRGKPPRQLTALGWPPGRLTRRLLHSSAPLRYGPNGSAPTRSYAPLRTAAQNRRDRQKASGAATPGQRITGPGSGNAPRVAGLRCGLGHALAPKVSLASARAGQLVPAPLPPQPARAEARRPRPRDPRHEAKAARLRALSALSLADWRPGHAAPVQRAEPASRFVSLDRRKPNARYALRPPRRKQACTPRRESGQLLLRRHGNEDSAACTELAALTTAPNVSPTSGRPCSALGLTAHPSTLEPRPGAAHSRPEVGTPRPPRPTTMRTSEANTARASLDFASFGTVMKDAPGSSHKSSYM